MSYDDGNALLMQGGLAPCKFPYPGYEIYMDVLSLPKAKQQLSIRDKTPETFKSGDPKLVFLIDVQTTERDPAIPEDSGKRTLWVGGSMQPPLRDAIRKVNANGVEPGGKLYVKRMADGPPKDGGQPPHTFFVAYTPPPAGGNAAMMAGGQSQPPSAPPAYPPQPAPQPNGGGGYQGWPQGAQPPAQPPAYAAPPAPPAYTPPAYGPPTPQPPVAQPPLYGPGAAPEYTAAAQAAQAYVPPSAYPPPGPQPGYGQPMGSTPPAPGGVNGAPPQGVDPAAWDRMSPADRGAVLTAMGLPAY